MVVNVAVLTSIYVKKTSDDSNLKTTHCLNGMYHALFHLIVCWLFYFVWLSAGCFVHLVAVLFGYLLIWQLAASK